MIKHSMPASTITMIAWGEKQAFLSRCSPVWMGRGWRLWAAAGIFTANIEIALKANWELAMSTRTFSFFVSVGCLSTLPVLAADWAQWRGPQRTGVSAEQGLAHQWPKDGPPLVWHVKDVGNGYGSPSVVGQRVYLLGSEGLENEFVEARRRGDGQQLWRRRIGNVGEPEQEPNFPAARSTPTIDGDRLYAFGSDGDIVCLETASGRVIWQKNVKKDFKGKSGGWAYSESPLVDGNVVVCTPGGFEAAMIALNKMTGDVVWKCPIDDAEEAGYASAVITNFGGKKQYVQFYSKGVIGVDAASGKYLWRALETEGDNLATPIVKDGFVYSPISGTGGGLGR